MCNKKILLILITSGVLLMSNIVNTQECQSIKASTPTSNFIVHNDGTITDKTTGLMWKVCTEGETWTAGSPAECTGRFTEISWQQALKKVESVNKGAGFPETAAAYKDWRIPTISELSSIVEQRCVDTAQNTELFLNPLHAFYWSSSPVVSKYSGDDSNASWAISFGSANGVFAVNRSNEADLTVRLVRAGQ